MRLSGERHVRLRVVLLSLRLSRAAAEVRSAVPRGRLTGAARPSASRTTSRRARRRRRAKQGVPDSVCSQHPAGTPDRPPGGCVSRTLHGLQSPSTWFLTWSRTDDASFSTILKARFLSVAQGFLWQRLQGFKTHLIRSSASPTRTDPLVAMH